MLWLTCKRPRIEFHCVLWTWISLELWKDSRWVGKSNSNRPSLTSSQVASRSSRADPTCRAWPAIRSTSQDAPPPVAADSDGWTLVQHPRAPPSRCDRRRSEFPREAAARSQTDGVHAPSNHISSTKASSEHASSSTSGSCSVDQYQSMSWYWHCLSLIAEGSCAENGKAMSRDGLEAKANLLKMFVRRLLIVAHLVSVVIFDGRWRRQRAENRNKLNSMYTGFSNFLTATDSWRGRATRGAGRRDPVDKSPASRWLDFHSNAACVHLHGHSWSFDSRCSTMSLEGETIKAINEAR